MADSTEWTFDGVRGQLVARRWAHAGPNHIVLLAHGYGEHVGRYERLADALVQNGAVVYAVDHMGHGKSAGERVLIDSYEDVVTDLHTLAQRAESEQPDLPVVLLGHSMGGLIGSRYAQRYEDSLTAFVISSPVIGSWDAATQLLRADQIPDVPLDVSTLSRDARVGERYSEDELVWHGPFKRPTLASLAETLLIINDGPQLSIPMMWIHGSDDQLVLLAESKPGVERLSRGKLTSVVYPGGRHELFNETNASEVTTDVTDWIRRELAYSR